MQYLPSDMPHHLRKIYGHFQRKTYPLTSVGVHYQGASILGASTLSQIRSLLTAQQTIKKASMSTAYEALTLLNSTTEEEYDGKVEQVPTITEQVPTITKQTDERDTTTANFLSLPRELHQKILSHQYDLHYNWLYHFVAVDNDEQAVKVPNLESWSKNLASVHPTIAEDVKFVASRWSVKRRNGWKEYCEGSGFWRK